MITALKIVFIPLAHSLISILGVGLSLSILLQERWHLKNTSPAGRILLSAALGILYNTLQFSLVVMVHHYRLLPQPAMAAIKYGVDLLLLITLSVAYGAKIGGEISRCIDAVFKRENLAIFVLLFFAGTRLMPAKLAIIESEFTAKTGDSAYSYRAPADGRTTFYSYLNRHSVFKK